MKPVAKRLVLTAGKKACCDVVDETSGQRRLAGVRDYESAAVVIEDKTTRSLSLRVREAPRQLTRYCRANIQSDRNDLDRAARD